MTRSVLAVGFIVVVGVAAVATSQRTTVLKGEVIASDILEHIEMKGLRMECEDSVIGRNGATFTCHVVGSDGSSAKVRYTMDRTGSIRGEQLNSD